MKDRPQVPASSKSKQRVLGRPSRSDLIATDTEALTGHTTRRGVIAAAAMGLGALVAGAIPANGSSAYSSTHQEIDLAASPSRVYSVLLDQKLFTAFSGASAQIDAQPGGALSLFQGHPPLLGVTGRILELVPDKRIVQAWRAGEWAPGEYSIVRFELAEKDQGTRIVFDQAGTVSVPGPGAWNKMYWDPLQKYLAS